VNPVTVTLAQRRAALKLQCAAQREQLAHAVAEIQEQLQGVDRVIGIVRGFRLSPAMVAGAAAVVLGIGSTRAVRLVGRGWLVFNTIQRIWRMFRRSREPE